MHHILHIVLLFTLFYSNLNAEDIDSIKNNETVETIQENYIPISDVPEQASTTIIKLQEISALLTESKDVLEIDNVLPSYMLSLQDMLDDPIYKHLDTNDLKSIDDLKQKWVIYLKQLEEWQIIIKNRLLLYDKERITLQTLTELWSETHIKANEQLVPKTILKHITSVLIKIETLNNTTKSNYDMLLTNIQFISNKILQINTKMDQLQVAHDKRLSNIFVLDSAPFIALLKTTPLDLKNYIHLGINSLKIFYENIYIYSTSNINNFYKLAGYMFLIILIISYLSYSNYRGKLFSQKLNSNNKQFSFLNHPISTIVILTTFFSIFLLDERPSDFKHFQVLIILIPIARILGDIIHKKLMPYIYTFFALYILYFFEQGISDYGLMDRISALVLLTTTFILICLAEHKKREIKDDNLSKLFYHSSKFLFLSCGLITVAFIANIYGTVALADRITSLIFTTLAFILIFYTLIHVLSGLIIIFIRKRIVYAPPSIQSQAKKLENNVVNLMVFAMVIWWLFIIINIFGARAMLLEWGISILAYSWKIGEVTFSVESIFNFFVIMTVTWLTARLFRILLALEIFTRFKFPRGVPTAISTMSNHTIFLIGTIAALSTLGISMQEFALIGGALGVGIGFGIRNIVANFVSGIIMLFERPVQIGDTIEINSTMGKVQSIGTRATSIKTFDGSEVLIPNADFIASDVTNWTLSDERRRATLVIKVDFDSDIDKVLKIMGDIAKSHKYVLKDPLPLATFQGFGDYYLEFKLYYWLSEEIIPTKSDVAIGIFKALVTNGIKIPTPTRNIAIHNEKNS